MKKILTLLFILFSVCTIHSYAQLYNKLITQNIEENNYIIKYSNVYNRKVLQDKFGNRISNTKIKTVISVLEMGGFSILLIEEYKKDPSCYIFCTEPTTSGDSSRFTEDYLTQWFGTTPSNLEKYQSLTNKEEKESFLKNVSLKIVKCSFSKIEEAKTGTLEAFVIKPALYIGDELIYYKIKED